MRKISQWFSFEKCKALVWRQKTKVVLHVGASAIPAHTPEIPDAFADVLSTDAELRAIELAFLQRLLTEAEHSGAEVLLKGGCSQEASVDTALAKMQSATFEVLAQELERAEPAKEGFGRFREKQDKEEPL